MQKKIFKPLALLSFVLLLAGCTFAGTENAGEVPGFFMGVWHGILAPFSLIVRFFIDIKMYAVPNSGLGYDIGFLLGIVGAVPLGWLATLISLGFYFLG